MELEGQPFQSALEGWGDGVVVLRSCDNDPICTGNLVVEVADGKAVRLVLILIKHRNILDFKKFDFTFDFKVALHKLQEHTVIGLVRIGANDCNKFHSISSLSLGFPNQNFQLLFSREPWHWTISPSS